MHFIYSEALPVDRSERKYNDGFACLNAIRHYKNKIIDAFCDMHVFSMHTRQKCWNKLLIKIFLLPQKMRYEKTLNLG